MGRFTGNNKCSSFTVHSYFKCSHASFTMAIHNTSSVMANVSDGLHKVEFSVFAQYDEAAKVCIQLNTDAITHTCVDVGENGEGQWINGSLSLNRKAIGERTHLVSVWAMTVLKGGLLKHQLSTLNSCYFRIDLQTQPTTSYQYRPKIVGTLASEPPFTMVAPYAPSWWAVTCLLSPSSNNGYRDGYSAVHYPDVRAAIYSPTYIPSLTQLAHVTDDESPEYSVIEAMYTY